MKISESFRVVTTRPLNALNKIGIAELAQYTDFNPTEALTKAMSADRAIRKEWNWEVDANDLEYLDFKGLRVYFKDGSTLTLKG